LGVIETVTMGHKLTVRVRNVDDEPSSFIHRLRNFAEELHLDLHRHGYGSVPNMDSAIDEVIVLVTSKRYFGNALTRARALLKHHHLDDDAIFERGTT
jgi:hypothetical protein